MSENDLPLEKKTETDPLVAFAKALREVDDTRRLDLNREPKPFVLQSGNCIRCHDRGPGVGNLTLTPLYDRNLVARYESSKVVEKTPEQRLAELPPVGQVAYVFSRLPEKFDLTMKDGKVGFATDFRAFIEAVPGVRLDDGAARLLGALKSMDLAGDKFSARLDKAQRIAVDVDLKVARVKEIRFGTAANPNVSFEVRFDPRDPDGVAIKNIEGLRLATDVGGLEIAVRAVALKTKDGKPVVEMTVDNPIKVPPTITVTQPLEKVVPGVDAVVVKHIVHALADAKSSVEKKDFAPYIEHVTEPGLRATLKKISEGVTSVSKDGDKLTLTRNNGVIDYSLGGPSIKVYPNVSFRIGKDADAPRIHDVQGVAFAVPLPAELKIGEKYYTGIKEISLGYVGRDGSRTLTVRTDGEVKNASVRLNGAMQPATDSGGSFYVDANVKNILSGNKGDNLAVRLRITNGQLNMTSGEIADIISRATWQAADFSPAGAGLTIISAASGVYSWLFD